jgi:hypothetical protein
LYKRYGRYLDKKTERITWRGWYGAHRMLEGITWRLLLIEYSRHRRSPSRLPDKLFYYMMGKLMKIGVTTSITR